MQARSNSQATPSKFRQPMCCSRQPFVVFLLIKTNPSTCQQLLITTKLYLQHCHRHFSEELCLLQVWDMRLGRNPLWLMLFLDPHQLHMVPEFPGFKKPSSFTFADFQRGQRKPWQGGSQGCTNSERGEWVLGFVNRFWDAYTQTHKQFISTFKILSAVFKRKANYPQAAPELEKAKLIMPKYGKWPSSFLTPLRAE